MSTEDSRRPAPPLDPPLGPPFVGALLRMAWTQVRDQLLRAIHDAGFTDFQEAHFVVLSYPPPDGVRPAELARQKRMSRQALNYLVAQLEELGYVERRAPDGGDRRLIYLTPRGWRVADAIFACLRQLHAYWAAEVGNARFNTFLDVLRRLTESTTTDLVSASEPDTPTH